MNLKTFLIIHLSQTYNSKLILLKQIKMSLKQNVWNLFILLLIYQTDTNTDLCTKSVKINLQISSFTTVSQNSPKSAEKLATFAAIMYWSNMSEFLGESLHYSDRSKSKLSLYTNQVRLIINI